MDSGGSAGGPTLDEFNPKGTLAIVAIYLSIFAMAWIIGYVVLLLDRLHLRGP